MCFQPTSDDDCTPTCTLQVIPALPIRSVYHAGADGVVFYSPPVNDFDDEHLTDYEAAAVRETD